MKKLRWEKFINDDNKVFLKAIKKMKILIYLNEKQS